MEIIYRVIKDRLIRDIWTILKQKSEKQKDRNYGENKLITD